MHNRLIDGSKAIPKVNFKFCYLMRCADITLTVASSRSMCNGQLSALVLGHVAGCGVRVVFVKQARTTMASCRCEIEFPYNSSWL